MVSTTYLYNELFKYGLSSTGNIQSDIAELKKIKKSKGESTTDVDNFSRAITGFKKAQQNKGVQQNQQMQGPPWNNLMQSLGLELQGSKDADFAAIESKISQLESMPLSSDQKASLEALKTQFEQMKQAEANRPQGQKIGQQGQPPQGGGQGEPPWFSLMKTLGIQPQGSKDADMAAISNRLVQMQSSTLSSDQKANIESMQAQLEQYQNS